MFVEAPTDLHFSITSKVAEVAEVVICEKPAVVTYEEFESWQRLQRNISAQGTLLRTNLTELASPVVDTARDWIDKHPELALESAVYYRGSNVAEFWASREGVKAHAHEDKAVHDVAVHVGLARPVAMRVEPSTRVHHWIEGYAGTISMKTSAVYDGRRDAPVRFEASVLGIPEQWLQEIDELKLGRSCLAVTKSPFPEAPAKDYFDWRIGVLRFVSKGQHHPSYLAMNFLSKADVKPWVMVAERGHWRELALPSDTPRSLRRIVQEALEMALEPRAMNGAFLDLPGEETVIRLTLDTSELVSKRAGQQAIPRAAPSQPRRSVGVPQMQVPLIQMKGRRYDASPKWGEDRVPQDSATKARQGMNTATVERTATLQPPVSEELAEEARNWTEERPAEPPRPAPPAQPEPAGMRRSVRFDKD